MWLLGLLKDVEGFPNVYSSDKVSSLIAPAISSTQKGFYTAQQVPPTEDSLAQSVGRLNPTEDSLAQTEDGSLPTGDSFAQTGDGLLPKGDSLSVKGNSLAQSVGSANPTGDLETSTFRFIRAA